VIFIYYVLIRLGEQAGDTGMMSPFVAMWAANVVLGIVAVVLLVLSQREAAFDPLDASHYKALLPVIRRPGRARGEVAVRAPARAGGPGRGPGGPRKVVVLRIPRLSLPLPGLLDRYIVRSYLGKFSLVVLAFWALFVLVSFMDLFDDVQHNKVKGVVVLHYYAFTSPQILHLITPVAVLVSVLVTFGILSRRNEITAMKAAGISIYRVTLPAIALGLAVASVMFGLAEFVLPQMNKVAGRDFNVIKGRPPQASTTNQHRWILGSDGRFYNYDFLEPRPEGASLYGLSIYDVTAADWQLRDVLYVARAAWNGVSYDLERGYRRTFLPSATFRTIPQARSREIEPPSYFGQEERPADTLRFGELRQHIASLELLGLDVTSLRVQLHRKIAFPIVCLVIDPARHPVRVRGGPPRRPLRHRRQRADRDRVLGLPRHLRRPRQQRAAAAAARGLGAEPAVRRQRAVPDVHARDVRERLAAVASWCAALALPLLVYLPTLGYGFVFDDQPLIVSNPALEAPVPPVRTSPATSTRSGSTRTPPAATTTARC
jgi:LPS export ABC transporter permease LptG